MVPKIKKEILLGTAIISFIIITNQQLLAQNNAKVMSNNCIDFSSNYSLRLNQDTKMFSIYRVSFGGDINLQISSGWFKSNRGKYFLTDSIGKFKLIYKFQEDKLFPLKTYCELSTIVWIMYKDSVFYPLYKDSTYVDNILKKEAQINSLSSKTYDLYYNGWVSILLFYDADRSYEIYDDGNLTSSGTWEKRSSKIIIHDECLNRKFSFKIKNGIIIKNNFPPTSTVDKFEKYVK